MSQDASATSAVSSKLVIRNIGLLLSGDLDRPILDADTVVCVDGVIQSVGRQADLDTAGATTTIDAKGTALAPGLIDSHIHPVCGDWTPRQNQTGWIDSCLHGGVTTMVSAGEVHTPGRPKDIVGLKAMAIFAQRAFHESAAAGLICLLLLTSLTAQVAPDWCRALPRLEYKTLERVPVSDPWFEVYKPAVGVFAIYEPHQAEETIGYLIVGEKRALLFDTGMGISDVKKVTAELTKSPIIVLNSHTHDDHVGGNWQFGAVYGMDTGFTRQNARGSRDDAQAEITPDQICGTLPKGFDEKSYQTRLWKIAKYIHDGERVDLGGRTIEVIATPGHTPDAISLFDRANGLLFTGDTYYPAPIWLFRPETDLDAYARSIRHLAALAPQVKMVLGAHNVPVAKPEVLARLVAAFDAVRAGKVTPTPESPGKVLYKVGDISFLMRAPASK